jgi:enoyl-CoA hydratase/carnithine racemase
MTDYLFRVCSERSFFQFPEVRIGIIPGALGTQLLPRLTSFNTSLSMCVGCSKLTAKEALNAGIVDQIIPNAVKKATDSTEDTTGSLVERMVNVLENQILRGEDAPNPYRRTR